MSCCGGHNHKPESRPEDEAEQQQTGQHKSHKWLMLLCCVLPIVLVMGYFMRNGGLKLTGNWAVLLMLLCPLSHLLILPLMKRQR